MPSDKNNSKLFKRSAGAKRFFPGRPREFWITASTLALSRIDTSPHIGLPNSSNPAYVSWLKKESMLSDANILAHKYSGKGSMWQNPFAKPRPHTAIKYASVWYTAYPISLITKQNESVIATLGDEKLWEAFETIGIRAMHTGPMKRAGGISGWKQTPSIDGHFDRISARIDPLLRIVDTLAPASIKIARAPVEAVPPPVATMDPELSMIGTVAGEHPDLAFDFAVAHADELGDRIDASSRTRYYPGLAGGSLDKAMIGKLNAYAEKNIPEPARRPVKSAVANIEYRLGVREERLPEIDAWLKKQGG